jgi:hypothetical protein
MKWQSGLINNNYQTFSLVCNSLFFIKFHKFAPGGFIEKHVDVDLPFNLLNVCLTFQKVFFCAGQKKGRVLTYKPDKEEHWIFNNSDKTILVLTLGLRRLGNAR